jgi:glycosyltransferase 2 family protein
MSAPARPRPSVVRRILSPRILLSFAVTALALWFALRDLDFHEVWHSLRKASLLPLLGLSVPAHLANIWMRGLRWRHLTERVADIPRSTFVRGQAVGFMANNVFPLRIGEVLRAWYVAREAGAPGAAILGTVIVERVIDAIVVLGLAALVLGLGGAKAAGLETRTVLFPLLAIALAPLGFVVLLRLFPKQVIEHGAKIWGRVLPEAASARLAAGLGHLAVGLRGLRGGAPLAWVALYSILMWLVIAVIPFAATIASLHIDLGSPARMLLASYAILMWVGAAVAIPSAPGFFGPYHAACWVALAPFGVPKEMAIALGTLAHGVFWLTTTIAGLAVMRSRKTPLPDLAEVAPE